MSKRRNCGWFRRGADPRRHPLTQQERRRGGCTRWAQVMIQVREGMGLWVPPHCYQAIEHLKRRKKC
jgi:hypothetical protein